MYVILKSLIHAFLDKTVNMHVYIYLKKIISYKIFDPLVGLALGINKQGPSSGKLDYHTILYGQGVTG